MRVETIAKPRKPYIPTRISVALFPAATKSCALLSQFKPQEHAGTERQQRANENTALKALLSAFMPVLEAEYGNGSENDYAMSVKAIKGIRYSAKDIPAFIAIAASYQDEPNFDEAAGYFLTALANSMRQKSISVDISMLETHLAYLGCYCNKDLTIIGNVGNYFGFGLERTGKLTLNGNSGEYTGQFMNDGEIVVNGNSGDLTGYGMENGLITVNGNCLGRAGGEAQFMGLSPTIHINGNIGSIFPGTKGNIFQHGRQIVKDGEEIDIIENK